MERGGEGYFVKGSFEYDEELKRAKRKMPENGGAEHSTKKKEVQTSH